MCSNAFAIVSHTKQWQQVFKLVMNLCTHDNGGLKLLNLMCLNQITYILMGIPGESKKTNI